MDYIKTGKAADDYTKEIDKSVTVLNKDEDWRDRHMTLQMKMDEKYEQGLKEGIEQGKKEGIEQGIVRSCKGLTGSKEAAIELLMTTSDMSREVVEEKVEKYW